ncbi:Ca2+:H+ antiporter [Strigomonas culicis]|uniref:Ca2+:H+ antiporter n=1 Tax=Strigomonas culicis TaxID=28005 RepID=S9UN45_9TRYP|nr:Ca2+:H+ antiporter [Strigomonas culicis]EPY30358.1 Ca2+:H+ antiporter [Strigomonas culicis]|eukprot:EPY22131.1 Ca2+:H+ antiporter [Strigomonas culicis]
MLSNALGVSKGYGATDGELTHPGIVHFQEEDLHEVRRTWAEQVRETVHYLWPVKALLLLLVPLVVLLSTHRERPLAELAAPPAFGVFLLCLVGLVPCATLAVEFAEDLVVRKDNAALGTVVNVIVEHLALIAFAVTALFMTNEARAFCVVKTVSIGCILLHLLAGLGGAIFFAPVTEENSFGATSLSAFNSGMLYCTAVFMFPTLYDYIIVTPEVQRAALLGKSNARAEAGLTAVSRGLSLCALCAYMAYLVSVFRTNVNYYTVGGNPNAPSSLPYAILYRERSRARPGPRALALGSRYSLLFAATGLVVFVLLQVGLCVGVALTLPVVAQAEVVSLPFLLVALLPLFFEFGSVGASWLMAREGRLDIAASVAFSCVTHVYMCVIPALVLFAWAIGRSLDLSFHPFLIFVCLLSVLVVTDFVMMNRIRWLQGAMLLSLYLLLVFTCLLGGWHLCFAASSDGTPCRGDHPC